MAAKGTIAKNNVAEKLATAFGEDWIGLYDGKYYVWANDGGQKVQIALSMTCPKVEVAVAAQPVVESNSWDWDDQPAASPKLVATGFQPAEITQDERDRVAELLAKLGL